MTMGSTGSKVEKATMQDALKYYQEDGYYINAALRNDRELDDKEKEYVRLLDKATSTKNVEHDTLYRVVDPQVVFGKLNELDVDNLRAHLLFGDAVYDRGAYSQGIKKRMESIVENAMGKEKLEKGFMSTTYDYDEAMHKITDQTHSNSIGIVLKIDNARKLKGTEIAGSEDFDEKEILLKRGYHYKFKNVKRVMKGQFPQVFIECEVF